MSIVIQSRTRHGWNLNGQNTPNWQQLKAEAKKNPPRWTLIMDNQGKAREWKDEIGGEVTYRSWDADEAYYHKTHSPQATAQQMARENELVKDCWQYYKMNEPGNDNWLELQDWLIAYAIEAKRLGFKVTTNGLAILKNWSDPAFVKAGNCDKLIRYWADNRDTFILNVHTYVTGAAWATVLPNYPLNLFDLNSSRDGYKTAHINWTSYEPIMWYHREAWVTNVRAVDLIGEPMDFIIDECWFDWHASVHDQMVTLNGRQVKMSDELRARYGDDRFNRDMRGIMGQRKFAEWAITGQLHTPVNDERYCDWLIQNYQWFENEYPDNALAFMNFTMNPDWRFPEGHDAIPLANALLPRMAMIKPRTPVIVIPPEPEPIPEVIMIPQQIKVHDSAVRIRKSPTIINSPLVAWFTPTEYTDVLLSETPVKVADGYVWHRIEWGVLQGYIAVSHTDGSILIDIFEEVEVPVFEVTPTEQALIEHIRNGDWFDAVTLLQHLWSDSL